MNVKVEFWRGALFYVEWRPKIKFYVAHFIKVNSAWRSESQN